MFKARACAQGKVLLALLLGFLASSLGFLNEGYRTTAVTITSPTNYASVSGTVTVVAAVASDVWWAKLDIDGIGGPVSPPYNFT